MRAVFALLVLLLASSALTQSVRKMEAGPTIFSEVRREVTRQKMAWPDLTQEEVGTFLIFTSDKDNADLTVVTSDPMESTLKKLKDVAIAVGLPETDFIVRQGRVTGTVDMEFNDAITKSEKSGSFTFPLKRLIQEISARKLPQPLVVALECDVESAVLKAGSKERRLQDPWTLMPVEEALEWESLAVKDTMAWWAPLAGWGLLLFAAGLILGLYGLFGRLIYSHYRQLKSPITPTEPVMTPQDVQEAYDQAARQPWWKKSLGALPFLILAPLLGVQLLGLNADRFLAQAIYGLPFELNASFLNFRLVLVMFLPLFLLMPVLLGMKSRLQKKEKALLPQTPIQEQNDDFERAMKPAVIVMIVMFIMFIAIMSFPDLVRKVPSYLVRPVLFTMVGIASGVMIFHLFRHSFATRSRPLSPDDSTAVEARRLGEKAGIKVRRVLVRECVSANAWATFFGTVGVTSKLKDEFQPEEIRAILAHEVGHLKAMDVPRLFWTSLVILSLFLALQFAVGRMDNSLGRTVSSFSGPLNIIALPLVVQFLMAPKKQKAELAADRFAVEATGDLDLVARTLIKIHDTNLSPHRLTEWDERMSSHPALTTRLKKLYEAVGQKPPVATSQPQHPPQE